MKLWGTGKPLREVLHVDEVASACEFFLRKKIQSIYKRRKIISRVLLTF